MKIFVLLLSIILLPASAFSAPVVFSDYETADNLSHQGTCDAGQTEVRVYQNETYFLKIITSKKNIYYIFSKDLSDSYHFFVKDAEGATLELDEEKWLESLKAGSPNAAKRLLGKQHDCAIQVLK